MPKTKLVACFLVLFGLLMGMGGTVMAQAVPGYPGKPIRIVSPFPPGASTDFYGRYIGHRLQEAWGQPVIVENRPGASGTMGSASVAKAAADGYTLLIVSTTAHTGALLQNPRPYDPVRDFSPVAMLFYFPLIVTANNDLPARNISELIALAKTKPGQLNFSSLGVGATDHLMMEMIMNQSGIKMVHVPYKGAAETLTAVMTGQVQVGFSIIAMAQTHIKAGKLRGLAVTSGRRSSAAPEIPTVAESGLPGFDAVIAVGILAPAGTPGPIITKLNSEIARIMTTPDAKATVAKGGFEAVGGYSPEYYGAHLKTEMEKWARLIRENNIKVN